MKNIVGIIAVAAMVAAPSFGKVRHGRGLFSKPGPQFQDFTKQKIQAPMPATLSYDEDDIDVSIDDEGPIAAPSKTDLKKKEDLNKKPEEKETVIGGKTFKPEDAGNLADKAGNLRKGEDLANGERDPGYATGESDNDDKDMAVNFTQNGSSSWGLMADCRCADNQCTLQPDGGAAVQSNQLPDPGLTQQLVARSRHHKWRDVDMPTALGGDLSDVIALSWGRSLAELGINANNHDYYYASTRDTQEDLSSMNFGGVVGVVLLKPIQGEPGRCAIVGGGGGAGAANNNDQNVGDALALDGPAAG